MSLPLPDYIFVEDKCEDCGVTFTRMQYDTQSVRCHKCSTIYELRRIANVLEAFVDMH